MRRLDLWLPALVGLGLLLLVVLLGRTDPNATPLNYRIYIVLLSLGAGAFAAVIPGIFRIRVDGPGIGIRAGTGLGVFTLVLMFTPVAERAGKTLGVDAPPPPPKLDKSLRGPVVAPQCPGRGGNTKTECIYPQDGLVFAKETAREVWDRREDYGGNPREENTAKIDEPRSATRICITVNCYPGSQKGTNIAAHIEVEQRCPHRFFSLFRCPPGFASWQP